MQKRAVIESFNEFPRFSKLITSAAGRVEPAKVLILGAGVAGLAALGLAKAMGAIVRANDARPEVKQQIESLGAEWVQPEYVEDLTGVGGYAKEASEKYKEAFKKMMEKQAKEVDIIIASALVPNKGAPIMIHKEAVKMMKPNSVIVDLVAEMGGNCAFTEKGKRIVTDNKVIILGYTDMPSRMAQQASELFAVNMYNLVEELCMIPKNPSNII